MTKQEVVKQESKNEQNTSNNLVFQSAEQKLSSVFMNGISKTGKELGFAFDDYQMYCAKECFTKAYELCISNSVDINKIKDNVQKVMTQAATFKLNLAAQPAECYMIIRDASKENKVPYLQFGVQGDGNDRLVEEFGTHVVKIHPHWLVRENDEFVNPSFCGIEVSPPKWTPKDYHSKVVKVVYPIEYDDKSIQYHIAERESVVINLIAHINQNLMNEYFGLSIYSVKTDNEKKEIIKKQQQMRKDLISKCDGKSIEEILAIPELDEFISPAWKSLHSRESMIVRKIRNNITRPIPKNLKNAYISSLYQELLDDDVLRGPSDMDPRINKEEALEAEINVQAQSTPIDFNVTVKGVNDDKDIEEEPKKEEVKKEPF